MRLSHVNVPMPRGREDDARRFYSDLLGLAEVPKPESMRARGGCWFDAGGRRAAAADERLVAAATDRPSAGGDPSLGGLDIHLRAGDEPPGDMRHFGLECDDVDATRARLAAAGVEIDPGNPAPWKRFFARDPFGNRIEFHERGGLRD